MNRTNGTEADDEEMIDACTFGWKYLDERSISVEVSRNEYHPTALTYTAGE